MENLQKFMRRFDQLRNDLLARLDKFEDNINDQVAGAIAFSVRTRMLQFISKGISPILGSGRFKEYKSISAVRQNRSEQRGLRRSIRNIGSSSSAAVVRLKRKQATLKKSADKLKKTYPYSVQKKYPSKKPRPVNLFLSGDFLSNLSYKLGLNGKKRVIEIGYFDALSAKKEQGHREGVNGQPSRPTIPKGGESFNETIKLDIMRILKQAMKKAFDVSFK